MNAFRRLHLTRDFFVPKGAVKVADKHSDAIAYVYGKAGAPYAMVFYGKQSKPVFHFRFKDEAARAARVAAAFKGRQAHDAFKAHALAAKKAWVPSFKVGDVFHTSWGYDQTNLNYYEIVKLVGAKMAEVRAIGAKSYNTGSMAGHATPLPGDFQGEAFRVVLRESGFKVNDHYAHLTGFTLVAGVKVYGTHYWSSYA